MLHMEEEGDTSELPAAGACALKGLVKNSGAIRGKLEALVDSHGGQLPTLSGLATWTTWEFSQLGSVSPGSLSFPLV